LILLVTLSFLTRSDGSIFIIVEFCEGTFQCRPWCRIILTTFGNETMRKLT